jgi:hypothetical protein
MIMILVFLALAMFVLRRNRTEPAPPALPMHNNGSQNATPRVLTSIICPW